MLEIGVQKKYEKKRKILASEVNDKAIRKTDVNVMMEMIDDAELAVKQKATSKSVKNLMGLYQKAIEYYSALDNKCFEDFLGRMTNLFKNEEIQKVLSQPEEEEKKEEVAEEPTKTGDSSTSDPPKSGEATFEDIPLNETQESAGDEEDKLIDDKSDK
jgi:hypothetical protein